MTPKEKAQELVDKFTLVGLQRRDEGIQCALIAVEEILSTFNNIDPGKEYWQQVKIEINNL